MFIYYKRLFKKDGGVLIIIGLTPLGEPLGLSAAVVSMGSNLLLLPEPPSWVNQDMLCVYYVSGHSYKAAAKNSGPSLA